MVSVSIGNARWKTQTKTEQNLQILTLFSRALILSLIPPTIWDHAFRTGISRSPCSPADFFLDVSQQDLRQALRRRCLRSTHLAGLQAAAMTGVEDAAIGYDRTDAFAGVQARPRR
jgi:hypothetical protein